MRPAPKPIAGSGAVKSNTSAMRLPRRLANIASATSTPTSPPWKDMPPSQMRSSAQRVVEDALGAVEQDPAEAPAEDHAERAVEDQVVHLGRRPGRARPRGAPAREPPRREEAHQVHEAVPADLQRPEREGDGIGVRIDEHEARILGKLLLSAGTTAVGGAARDRQACRDTERDRREHRKDRGLWEKLRRRKVVQWGLAYGLFAWGLLQGLEYLERHLRLAAAAAAARHARVPDRAADRAGRRLVPRRPRRAAGRPPRSS